MSRKLNVSQRAVLERLCTYPERPPSSETWRHATRALEGGGLVPVSSVGQNCSALLVSADTCWSTANIQRAVRAGVGCLRHRRDQPVRSCLCIGIRSPASDQLLGFVVDQLVEDR